ncbi:MAG: integrin alpha [candidate division Zixibacteria bacterium]|nr:integrin alpha [candidate division Zixibacteria bacterium]
MRIRAGVLAVFLLVLILPAVTFGQFNLHYQKDGAAAQDFLGWSVASAGDVNGDGKADFIIGLPAFELEGELNTGLAVVYSGASGAVLHTRKGDGNLFLLGWSVAGAGDVNGDGNDDYIVGAPFSGQVNGSAFVYSGGGVLPLYQKGGAVEDLLGFSVASAGDVNGDGRADFIIGAPGADPTAGFSGAGSAYVYSGADGSLLYEKNGGTIGDSLGFSVASAGDDNGDGKADFIIGTPRNDPLRQDDAGTAYVYSGADGSLLYQKHGAAAGDLLGFSAASAGDVNGDGKADFIIGAPFMDVGLLSDAGTAYVYSGADGSLLYLKNGVAAGDYLGFSVASAGDVNGDGKADFIIGAPSAGAGGLSGAGSAYVHSGADGSLLGQINGAAVGDSLGFSVASAGDVNGDGKADLIIGAPSTNPGGAAKAGSAFVYGLCAAVKGDMNGSGTLSGADIVLLINCTFNENGTGTIGGDCNLCYADVNCTGNLSGADIVSLIAATFNEAPFPC